MKDNKFSTLVKPVVVLFAICLVVSVLLAYTNRITAPIIAENKKAAAEATRSAVLEGSTSFTFIPCDTEALGIESAYREDSGLGYVITAGYKGYGGVVTVTVGLDPQGKVVGISADVSKETSGVGSKAGKEDYLAQYKGLQGSAEGADTISGATYSSTAVKTGVNAVLAAYDKIK